MLIDAKDLQGSKIALNTKKVVRLRNSYGAIEPKNSVKLDLEGKQIFVSDKIEGLVKRIRKHERLAKLTTPVGIAVYVAADRVVDVHEPSEADDHPNAKAVVSIDINQKATIDQQVKEKVEKVLNAINDA